MLDNNNFFCKTVIELSKISAKQIKTSAVIHSDFTVEQRISTIPIDGILEKNYLDLLSTCGLVPIGFRIFKWKANFYHAWHIDGRHIDETLQKIMPFSLNWILSGNGEIQWNTSMQIDSNIYKNSYASKLSSSDDLYDISVSGHQYFVNTAIPHRVVTGPDDRISLGILWDEKSYDITFQEACKRLKSVGLTN